MNGTIQPLSKLHPLIGNFQLLLQYHFSGEKSFFRLQPHIVNTDRLIRQIDENGKDFGLKNNLTSKFKYGNSNEMIGFHHQLQGAAMGWFLFRF